MPFATIVICTRNRAASLGRTLQQLCGQSDLAAGEWNLLVVNNGSEDDTESVVASFADRLPISCAYEGQPGVSVARNRGIAEADGEYILWTDDDVIHSDGWAASYLKAFRAHPDLAIFGGPIDVLYEDPDNVPDWMLANQDALQLLLTVRDIEGAELPIPNARRLLPFGANAAVKREVQRAFPYNRELGYAPGRSRGGEEMDSFERMIAAGHRGRWVPEARVEHVTAKSRQTLEHVCSFYYSLGEASTFDRTFSEVGLGSLAVTISKYAAARGLYALLKLAGPVHSVPMLTTACFHAGALQVFRSRERRIETVVPPYSIA